MAVQITKSFTDFKIGIGNYEIKAGDIIVFNETDYIPSKVIRINPDGSRSDIPVQMPNGTNLVTITEKNNMIAYSMLKNNLEDGTSN